MTVAAEDTMVRLLMQAAGGNVADDRDIILARAAGRWAHACAGWQPYLLDSFTFQRSGLQYWILVDAQQRLEIRTGLAGTWHRHLCQHVGDVGHALDVLAGERLIPGRFSTLGRRALEDFAAASERSAQVMLELADDFDTDCTAGDPVEPWELRVRAETLRLAAAQMRAFPGAELAVTS